MTTLLREQQERLLGQLEDHRREQQTFSHGFLRPMEAQMAELDERMAAVEEADPMGQVRQQR